MRRFGLMSLALIGIASVAAYASLAHAHGVPDGDKAFIEQTIGLQLGPFVYLGAKHMVTGYDHLLFLFGVIFFLYRVNEIGTFVTLFAVGHSITLLTGVLTETQINPYIVDAVIGLSVVYKALDNMGAFRLWIGFQPNTKAAVLIFGLFHGFGLATKLQDFSLSPEGLVGNIIAFNVGVEIGQFLALGVILIAMSYWRYSPSFVRTAFAANTVLMTCGFVLMGMQIAGYFVS